MSASSNFPKPLGGLGRVTTGRLIQRRSDNLLRENLFSCFLYQEYMFEEGSFRRRPRGFRRKALKPYPGPGLYQSPVPSHVPESCPPGPVRHSVGSGGHYEAVSPVVTSSASEFSHGAHPISAHAPVDPLLPTSVSHHSFVPFNNNHVSSSVLSGKRKYVCHDETFYA